MYSSKFNLLLIVIRNSFIDFDLLIVMFSISNLLLALLFLFPFAILLLEISHYLQSYCFLLTFLQLILVLLF